VTDSGRQDVGGRRGPTVEIPLVDDCAACVGLCCVALTFARSPEFALDKPAGQPCPHLERDFLCGIHDRLAAAGFPGCVTFSCFGAGPTLVRSRAMAGWDAGPGASAALIAAFPAARRLHELLWYVREALAAPVADPVRHHLLQSHDRVQATAQMPAERLAGIDVPALRDEVNEVLQQASVQLRGPRPGRDLAGADLVGARLRGRDLRRASLRGARLVAADLRDADLRGADLTGADLRDADLSGADLRGALFVTPLQLRSARSTAGALLPAVEGLGPWPPQGPELRLAQQHERARQDRRRQRARRASRSRGRGSPSGS